MLCTIPAVAKASTHTLHLAPCSLQVSAVSRESIDALKQFFADDMTKDDWRLIIKLKKVFQVT